MVDVPPPCPSLQQHHVEGALLYADRTDMVRALRPGEGGTIAELGVALGDFSEFLIEELHPKRFYAIDIYTMHEYPLIFGHPSEVLLKGMNHLDFYTQRFAKFGDGVKIEVGPSSDTLESFPDAYFDMIYVDAGHDYLSVRNDAEVSARKLTHDGTLIFNDYTVGDPLTNSRYGVVQAVNEMITNGGWRVVGFSLQHDMFCDIALQRA